MSLKNARSGNASNSGGATAPHSTTGTPDKWIMRACQKPCPPAWMWMSGPPPRSSTVTVSCGAGAKTITSALTLVWCPGRRPA